MPQPHQVRDLQRLSALFCGLLRDFGQSIRIFSQTAGRNSQIETADFILRLSASEATLSLSLCPVAETCDADPRKTEATLAWLVRAACPILHPQSIRWREHDRVLDTETWIAALRPIQPRRVRPQFRQAEPRPLSGPGVAVWPDRPGDVRQIARRERRTPEAAMSARYAQWQPSRDKAPDDSLARPDPGDSLARPEPWPFRVGSWALAGATGVLCLPAGASMACLTLARRADLRLNLHALTLTLVIVSLHQSGALAVTLRVLGF